MRMRNQQFGSRQWSVTNGPLVVLGEHKNRDGPLIYYRRDGPLFVTGPPCGKDPPAGTGPPSTHGPPGRTGSRHETGPPNGHGPPFKKEQAGVEFESTKVMEKQNINLKHEESKMKNFKLKRLLGLVFVGCISALHASSVFAAAGTTIGNRATLTFDVGGTATVLESAPGVGNTTTGATFGSDTNFIEDRLINFTVAIVDVATIPVAPSSTLQVLTFTVTNNGNGTQDFLLAAINSLGGADPFVGGNADSFDPTLVQVFVDNGVAGYVQGDDTDIFIDELAAGDDITVYIVSTIPASSLPLANDDVSVLTLVAQVAAGGAAGQGAEIMRDDNGNVSPAGTYNNGAFGPTTPVAAVDVADTVLTEDIVFNDPAGATAVDVDSAGVQDVVQNGQHADASSYTVGAAELTVTKTSVVIRDPVNLNSNPKAIPGAFVQYTITIANAATAGASGDLTTLADILVLTDLDPDLNTALGVAESAAGDSVRINTTGTLRPLAGTTYCTQAADADGCDHTAGIGNTLTVDFTTVTGMAVEVGYTAGELKAGESVVIVFNAIVQ